jgi:hypothetical protein
MQKLRKNKKTEKEKEKKSEPTGPTRPNRPVICAARGGRFYPLLAPDSPREPARSAPIFFYISRFFRPTSTQIRISQDLQHIFQSRLFLYVPNSKP